MEEVGFFRAVIHGQTTGDSGFPRIPHPLQTCQELAVLFSLEAYIRVIPVLIQRRSSTFVAYS